MTPIRSKKRILRAVLKSRAFWISIAVVVVISIATLAGRWGHGKWTNRQSWKLAGLAEQQAREGRTKEALMSLETSLRLRPDNPSALRQLARLRTALGQRKEALAAWQKLSEAKALTAVDAQEYGLLAGIEGEWALANRIIDHFRAGNQGPEPELLRAQILDMRGNKPGAEESLRQAVEKDKTERSRAILARFLLANRLNSTTAPEILSLHRSLIESPNDAGAQAQADALLAGIVPPGERAQWIESLRKHPKTTPALLLAADSAEAASNPAAAPILAAKVFSRLEKSPVEERRLGFLWLCRHNQPFRALRLLTRDEAIADPAAFSAWLEALAATGQADKIPEAPRILEKAKGKAVKVVSALLPSLPGKHRYKILYMVRPTAQVVDSQWAMLARQGKQPRSEKQHLLETQEHHSRQIREVLKKSDRVELLEIDYPALVADPQPVLARIAEFLGESFQNGPQVAACVRPALHRQRG